VNGDLQELLSAIDKVPWSKLDHAYGPATDVPDLIHALLSPNSQVRSDAWLKLHGNIWHQGTIYEATAHTVPIFLELLRQPATPAKHEILVFLALLFAGKSYWDVHQHLTTSAAEVRTPDFQQRVERELSWVEATKNAVVKGKDSYLELLKRGVEGDKIAAAYLLGLIGDSDFDTLEEIIKGGSRR
jgi:hypothetical protein